MIENDQIVTGTDITEEPKVMPKVTATKPGRTSKPGKPRVRREVTLSAQQRRDLKAVVDTYDPEDIASITLSILGRQLLTVNNPSLLHKYADTILRYSDQLNKDRELQDLMNFSIHINPPRDTNQDPDTPNTK